MHKTEFDFDGQTNSLSGPVGSALAGLERRAEQRLERRPEERPEWRSD
jgi:hypothetical protein